MTAQAINGIGRERIMLMGPNRVFYLGLLGAPALRSFGSLTIYAALDKPFRLCLDGKHWMQRRMAVVPPYLAHRIETDDQMIGNIMIEPESVDMKQLPSALSPYATDWDCSAALARIHAAYSYLQKIGIGATVQGLDVDQLFFGTQLADRAMDPRIAATIDKIKQDPACYYAAEDCAGEMDLSFSRFLHLFKDEMDVTFRKFRAWKRARSVLYHVNRSSTLTDIALEVGYPDSTHFSHSIRQFYGLRPKEIFAGSRRLAILLQESMQVRALPTPAGAAESL